MKRRPAVAVVVVALAIFAATGTAEAKTKHETCIDLAHPKKKCALPHATKKQVKEAAKALKKAGK